MRNFILDILADSLRVKESAVRDNLEQIIRWADHLVACIAAGRKILIFGNGGSAADAQHIAAEFVNRFRLERPPLAALALTTDTSILTSIGNDYHFDQIFSKQIRALGRKDDIAWAISTSGNSPNVLEGVLAAREAGMLVVGMSGPGGRLAEAADVAIRVDSPVTARIQEAHITIVHLLCALVVRIFFE